MPGNCVACPAATSLHLRRSAARRKSRGAAAFSARRPAPAPLPRCDRCKRCLRRERPGPAASHTQCRTAQRRRPADPVFEGSDSESTPSRGPEMFTVPLGDGRAHGRAACAFPRCACPARRLRSAAALSGAAGARRGACCAVTHAPPEPGIAPLEPHSGVFHRVLQCSARSSLLRFSSLAI